MNEDLTKHFVADFETTTDENDCRVWAFGICSVDDSFSFQYGNDLDVFMLWCANSKENYKVAFHNLKFDSAFILNWLNQNGFTRIEDKKDKANKTYTTLISDMGAYYQIEVFFEDYCTIRRDMISEGIMKREGTRYTRKQ